MKINHIYTLFIGTLFMYNSLSQSCFDVIGIITRTSNAIEQSDNSKIQQLWYQFFAHNMLEKIPNKLDTNMVALYYDYESDKSGLYTYLIGARVNPTSTIPEGMIAYHVPEQKYAEFITNSGQIGTVMLSKWMDIWNLEDTGNLKRTYLVDYELYDKKSLGPDSAQGQIYIGIR